MKNKKKKKILTHCRRSHSCIWRTQQAI